MNNKLKPFRLINDLELKRLQQLFAKNVLLWNEQHALFPLSCGLERNPIPPQMDKDYVLITEQEQPIALLTHHDLSTIKNCLFGDVSGCFDAISETYFIALLSQLFGTQSLRRQSSTRTDTLHLDEWFYAGSPSMAMTLKGGGQSMTLYLHPQWVLKALPPHEMVQSSIGNFRDALDPQLLHGQVELNPVSLQLEDMIRLQVGDVIRTDHPLTAPLLLKYNQQTLCQVEIGEINHYKSIQITSSL